ncbi:hypothetical protein OAX78_01580 [Planctomycetota bacterium]|nr:hypothetical protein [Planctomycetota bacterium]
MSTTQFALSPRAQAASLRCPLCLDDLQALVAEVCAGCGTAHHTVCARELGGCAVLGCMPLPQGVSRWARARSWFATGFVGLPGIRQLLTSERGPGLGMLLGLVVGVLATFTLPIHPLLGIMGGAYLGFLAGFGLSPDP